MAWLAHGWSPRGARAYGQSRLAYSGSRAHLHTHPPGSNPGQTFDRTSTCKAQKTSTTLYSEGGTSYGIRTVGGQEQKPKIQNKPTQNG